MGALGAGGHAGDRGSPAGELDGDATETATPAEPEPTTGIDPIEALVGRTVDEVTDALIVQTLQRCGGNRTKTAETLGIGVRTLFNRLRALEQEMPA